MDDRTSSDTPERSLSPSRSGISLQQRPPSFTIHRRISLSEEVNARNEGALEDTKNFYGLRSSSPASTSRPTKLPRSNSRISSLARPPSPTSTETPISPPRKPLPLPIPRAFITPKKPAAAIRLEAREKEKALAQKRGSGLSRDTGFEEIHPTKRGSGWSEREKQGNEHGISRDGFGLGDALSMGPIGEIDDEGGPKPAKSLRRSITEVSITPTRTHPTEHSSDNLVHPRRQSHTTHTTRPSASLEKEHDEGPRRRGNTRPLVGDGRVRKYKLFENPQTTFFCGGRAMTGGDSLVSVVLTMVIMLGLTGVWLGTTGVWLWVHGNEYGLAKGAGIGIVIVLVYLFGVSFSSLIASAIRDPGIIPRNLDPDPPVAYVESYWEALPREVPVKDGKIPVKYCETCRIYRPPRCSHCRVCGNCVDGIDHHCAYLHNCVGKRTYLSFLTLLISSTIASIYIVVFSAIHFYLLCHHDHISFNRALSESPGAAVSFLLGLIVLPAILFLLFYHTRLMLHNLTTVEQIRASASSHFFSAYKRPDNPFAQDSLASNVLLASLARPQFPSWVDASGWHVEDKRSPNPALTDPKWAREVV